MIEEEEVSIVEEDTLMLISALVQRLRTCEPKIVCSVCSQLCAAFERYSTEFAQHPERRLEPQQADQLTDTLAEAAPWVFRPQNLMRCPYSWNSNFSDGLAASKKRRRRLGAAAAAPRRCCGGDATAAAAPPPQRLTVSDRPGR